MYISVLIDLSQTNHREKGTQFSLWVYGNMYTVKGVFFSFSFELLLLFCITFPLPLLLFCITFRHYMLLIFLL